MEVNVDRGAEEIMRAAQSAGQVSDIKGEPGTNVGGMLEKVRVVMGNLTDRQPSEIQVTDLLAVDTEVPQKVVGGIADEFSMEAAVGIAAMVKADRLQMQRIADEMGRELNIEVAGRRRRGGHGRSGAP